MWSKRSFPRKPAKGGRTKGRKKGPNQLEKDYMAHLELLRCAGEISEYSFETIKLRLATNTFYEPDFLVTLMDGTVEIHEVKGVWEDDARAKIKIAADRFPFRFVAVTREKNVWMYEKFFIE